MKDLILHLLAAIASFGIAVGLMQGIVQEYISFADPINEMAMCVAAMMAGSGFMFVVVDELKKKFK